MTRACSNIPLRYRREINMGGRPCRDPRIVPLQFHVCNKLLFVQSPGLAPLELFDGPSGGAYDRTEIPRTRPRNHKLNRRLALALAADSRGVRPDHFFAPLRTASWSCSAAFA